MKLILKIIIALGLSYLFLWGCAGVYFTYVGIDVEKVRQHLSQSNGKEVKLEKIITTWKGFSPALHIEGLEIAGQTDQHPALAFKSMSLVVSPLSLLRLWPQFSEVALEKPQLEIISLPNKQLSIAGIVISTGGESLIKPKQIMSWMLGHKNIAWHNGEVTWRHLNKKQRQYRDISFVYERQSKRRQISAAMAGPDGPLAFKMSVTGDVLETSDWDATFEVLGEQGEALLASEDIAMFVKNGHGSLQLKSLGVEQIQDFLLISGLAANTNWIFDAKLTGRLYNIRFDFSGALLDMADWSLTGFASEVGFNASTQAPSMNNLQGNIKATSVGGNFQFSTSSSVFSWPRWFVQDIPVVNASGQIKWEKTSSGSMQFVLDDGVFNDGVLSVTDINANCTVQLQSQQETGISQLFTLNSIRDLKFEHANVAMDEKVGDDFFGTLYLDASAKFELKSVAQIAKYLPNVKGIGSFRQWWKQSFVSGEAHNGSISYTGEVSKQALKSGESHFTGRADVNDVELNYAKDWPTVSKARAVISLDNDRLTILPSEALWHSEPVHDTKLTIDRLFDRERQLDLQASGNVSLTKLLDFLFDGPLVAPEQRGKGLPVKANSGDVKAQVAVSIPLSKISSTSVNGTAVVSDGIIVLPQGVAVSDVTGLVDFTERSVNADNIKGHFLGGDVEGRLLTTQAAQPPKIRLSMKGEGDVEALEPWVGEHILSWLKGRMNWQGGLSIDGDKINLDAKSNMVGITVSAPEPLKKEADQAKLFELKMQIGSNKVQNTLKVLYGTNLYASFAGEIAEKNTLFDSSLVKLTDDVVASTNKLEPGINFLVDYNQLDLDSWVSALIDIASLKTKPLAVPNTDFLDAMRTVKIRSSAPLFLARPFGSIDLSAVSVDGANWIGSINGDNVNGTLQAEPRTGNGRYRVNLSRLQIAESLSQGLAPEPLDTTLNPQKYPDIGIRVDSFWLAGRSLGQLDVAGSAKGDAWELTKLSLVNQGHETIGNGMWSGANVGSTRTVVNFTTNIDGAGGVLDEMNFDGILKKGDGKFEANIDWAGAPHEFDFARLNGKYNFDLSDGELVQVEPGSGKLVGLLNSNAIARRLIFDFRDVFSSGLSFDRLHANGVLADGKVIMNDAYMLTPAAFIKMQGNLDLAQETIDMDVHVAPELGGNLALLGAFANPAAGALIFITQKLFKDEMRSANLKSYRLQGTWDDFEMVDMGGKSDKADKTNEVPVKPESHDEPPQ